MRTGGRGRAWVALLAPPLVLGICFAPVVAYFAKSRGLVGLQLQRAVEGAAVLPACLAFLLVFAATRRFANLDGYSLAAIGWRRPSLADVCIGFTLSLLASSLQLNVFIPWLARVQPSFDPGVLSMGMAAVVMTLGTSIIAEETLYRGYAWEVLRMRHGAVAAVCATSGGYVLLAPGTEWPLKAWSLGFGIVLAALRAWRGTIWPGLFMHVSVSLVPVLVARGE